MNSNCFYILVIILVSPTMRAQTFSPTQMHADLDYLNSKLKKYHPSYYAYTPKNEMDSFYREAKNKTDSALDYFSFKQIVRDLVGKVKCGHMEVLNPKNFVWKDSQWVIPIDVFLVDNKLYIRNYWDRDSILKTGDRILAINNRTEAQMLLQMREQIFADGDHTSFKDNQIENHFFIYHRFAFGSSQTYKVKIEDKLGEQKTVSILGQAFPDTITSFQHNKLDSSHIIFKADHVVLLVEMKNTLRIQITAFKGRNQRRAFKKIFKYIANHKIENVIVDLRGNGGGNVFTGYHFLSYFVKSKVFGFTLSRKPNISFLNQGLYMHFVDRVTPILFSLNPLQFPSRHGWQHYFPFVKKCRNHYDQKTFILTDGHTFSMAGIVATILKQKLAAVSVGSETGGSEFACRGMSEGRITLPCSKMEVHLKLYQLQYGRSPDSRHGLQPDYKTHYSIEDRFAKRDLEMEQIMRLIKP